MTEAEIRDNLIKGCIAWYPFETNKTILIITGIFPEFDVLSDYLYGRNISTDVINIDALLRSSALDNIRDSYDYIISALALESTLATSEKSAFESANALKDSLSWINTHLAPEGKLLILADNRLALRYFCGDKDLFSNHVFDSIENYSSCGNQILTGKSLNKNEWTKMLNNAGFNYTKVYGVFPSIFEANIFVADGYQPNENLVERITPYYKNPHTIFLNEFPLYKQFQENDMLVTVANSFFIEASALDNLTAYNQISVQGNRDYNESLITYITDSTVIKKPMWPQSCERIQALADNSDYLAAHGVPMVSYKLEGDNITGNSLSVPYIKGQILSEYFQQLVQTNVNELLTLLDKYVDIVEHSSELVPYEDMDWSKFDPYWDRRKTDDPNIDYWKNLAFGSDEDKKKVGKILKRGYLDLTTINCIYDNGSFHFFDQEFYIENLPANVLIYRAIEYIYMNDPKLNKYYPKQELLKRYSLDEHIITWNQYVTRLLSKLLKSDELSIFHKSHQTDYKTRIENRFRMDYSQEEFSRLFENIFSNVYSKKCYIFGSGRFAQRFLDIYGAYLDIAGIIDNNSDKWGQKLNGIEILSPNDIEKEKTNCKVIICIKYYEEVLEQLKELGVADLAVYDPRLTHPLPHRPKLALSQSDSTSSKPYHRGYIVGVFDLFHAGHVKLLKRAKEQCDYLIVGVTSDEFARNGKKTKPHYCLADRLEIVGSSQYVDEVIALPDEAVDAEVAYQLLKFDVQFSGSDYANDPVWLARREYLRQRGSDIVFFPYTEGVSTTKIKEELKADKQRG